MSIKPILFNTDMVRAILDGRKTVTRRVITPQPEMALAYVIAGHNWGKWKYSVFAEEDFKKYKNENLYWTPPCNAGDILYVRETWQCINPYSDKEYVYKASCDADFASDIGKWLPSIHMPKEAARIWLKVTNVRVERLRRMSHEDMRKEGIHYRECPDGFTWKTSTDMNYCYVTHSGAFEALWNSTVNKADMECYGWESNPWVWVIEFERCEKPQEVEQ